jgi:thymidylate synthase
MFNIILALDDEYGIGMINPSNINGLEWLINEDILQFKTITTRINNSILIMGRHTAEHLKKPLSGRYNIVLTKDMNYRIHEGFIPCTSLLHALSIIQNDINYGEIFLIGGKNVILEALQYPNLIDNIYLTHIHKNYNLDIKLIELKSFIETKCKLIVNEDKCTLESCDNQYINISLSIYVVNNHHINKEEEKYLTTMFNLIKKENIRNTRNAITFSKFSTKLSFNLKNNTIPVLTTKKIYWKGVVGELLFFLSGQTNNKILQKQNIHIWDNNTSQEFIDKIGLSYKLDDMGPMYGFQWRYFNAPYEGCDKNYHDQGIDQFAEIIELLLKDPFSRRILMTTYNPSQVKEGVLYPCHGISLQFYVNNDYSIDTQMIQRSADWFLGVPFNIASYALLVHIIVNILNNHSDKKTDVQYSAGVLYMIFGDYHLYEIHKHQALMQYGRIPKSFPKLKINKEITSITPEYFANELNIRDFELIDYDPEPAIKADMIA